MDTGDLLKAREETHGHFSDVARVAQAIKTAFYDPVESGAGVELNEIQHEALESIAVKMARIVCGDPGHLDHWVDIAGYARLVADYLERQKHPYDHVVMPPAAPQFRDGPPSPSAGYQPPSGLSEGGRGEPLPQSIQFYEDRRYGDGGPLPEEVRRDTTVTPPAPPKMHSSSIVLCTICGAPDGTHYGACPNKVL